MRWPPRSNRSTMLAPMRPSPMNPNSMSSSFDFVGAGPRACPYSRTPNMAVHRQGRHGDLPLLKASNRRLDGPADVLDALGEVPFDVQPDGPAAVLLQGLEVAHRLGAYEGAEAERLAGDREV